VRLVLWDIDGTLVDSVRLGLAAFEDAFEHVTGKQPAESVPFAGRTDYEIAVDLLDRSGIELHDGLLERFGVELERAMVRRAGELRARGRAYPGARDCLERLGREPDVVQSLLTGNIAPNAQVKLGAFALDTLVDLEIGAYGSDHDRRGRLVGIALQKCERKHGATLAPRDVVLVGDTPLDVAAAREGGARAVAVATGPFGASELAAAGADVVLADLRDTEAVVAAVLAN
jgi:phosphoglycolate phosphatase-like HAD superfamily hydrolase